MKLWPSNGDVKIITGRPRHPRTQGLVEQVHDSLHKLLASKRAKKPGSGWLEFLYEIQYSLNTQGHSSIKMTPFETVFGQKTNDGICVGLQETDEFIDEEKVEYMFDTDRDLQTGVWTDNGTDSQTETETVYFTETDSQTEAETDSQTETETDSQTETETDSQTETETDSQTETETNSQTEIETNSHTDEQTRTVTDAQIETGSACGDSMVDLSCSQTNMFSIMADVHVKRRRIETTEISTETYDVTDYRPTQDELMAVDDFMVLNDIIIDPTDDRNCTVKTDDGQITTHDRIRQMLDRNYKKSVENTMRKYNKKVSV